MASRRDVLRIEITVLTIERAKRLLVLKFILLVAVLGSFFDFTIEPNYAFYFYLQHFLELQRVQFLLV